MNESNTFVGYRKALITGNPADKFCKVCGNNEIASIEHILQKCNAQKQFHMDKHDKIGLTIWNWLYKLHTQCSKPQNPKFNKKLKYVKKYTI